MPFCHDGQAAKRKAAKKALGEDVAMVDSTDVKASRKIWGFGPSHPPKHGMAWHGMAWHLLGCHI